MSYEGGISYASPNLVEEVTSQENEPRQEYTIAPMERPSFDLDDSFENDPETSELSDAERVEVLKTELIHSEEKYIDSIVDFLHLDEGAQQELIDSGVQNETAVYGSELIKSIIRLNQAVLTYGTTDNVIGPDKSIEDIIGLMDTIMRSDRSYSQERSNYIRNRVESQMQAVLVGAKAEFATADAFHNHLNREVLYPGVNEIVNEDLQGIDWWVKLGKGNTYSLQVKSVEQANSARNRIFYDLPTNDPKRLSQSLDEIVSVVGDRKFDQIEHSLGKQLHYMREYHPKKKAGLVLLNPIDDIDYKTGVLNRQAQDKMAIASSDILSRENRAFVA